MRETADGAGVLEGGRRVRVRVRSHPHYGLFVEILGHQGAVGSIDWLDDAVGYGPVAEDRTSSPTRHARHRR
jgi:hypothetical protein